MKAAGVSVVVYGHVAHASTIALTPPIYIKQLGVVLFLFATGFTLARERRDTPEVLFNRLFPVYLFGVALAMAITAIGLLTGTGLALSNYLPFLGGANIIFNNFPANPSTWYVGTYIHFLVIWAVWLRQVPVRPWMAAALLLIEIPVRMMLITAEQPYIAYMLVTNWGAVFLLGLARGAGGESERRPHALAYTILLLGGLATSALAIGSGSLDRTFPFMTITGVSPLTGTLMLSTAVSFIYLFAASATFEATRSMPVPAAVRFLARNSLIIFLAHMPVFFALQPILVGWGLTYWMRVAIQLTLCLGVLALVSEAIVTAIRPERLRAAIVESLRNRRQFVEAAAGPVAIKGHRR
jgi:peptidoglycan/LPS O-acetylase OafA/YrhL